MTRFLGAVAVTLLLLAGCSSDDGSGSTTTTAPAGEDAGSTGAVSQVTVPDAYTSVVSEVIGAPTFPFLGTDGMYHVAYDLELTNTSPAVTATVDKVEVVDGQSPDDVITTIEGDQLVDPECQYGDCDRLRSLFAQPVDDATIAPQEGAIVFIDFAFATLDEVPDVVLHHLYLDAANSPASQEPVPVDYLTTPYGINDGEAKVIGPPVTGSRWVALNGCCEPGFPHRSSPAPLNGQLINAQRFAIDWKQMDEQGRFFEGDPNDNESYVDYGADVLAVGDGTVVSTMDGMEANAPGVLPSSDPELRDSITVETVDGNHIVVDLGDGTYAFYAHLKAGSLEVEEGDTVTKGQKIGELGNTGNANASHLHLHLMDGPSILGSNGIPYVIDSFDFAGQVAPETLIESDDFLAGVFNEGQTDPEPREDESPLLLDIIDFPEASGG